MALAEADLLEQEHEREVLAALMVAAGVPELTLPPRPAWMALGACRDHPEVDFYDAPRRAARAKRICAGCPVREACLRWAMEHDEPDGVWGGLTPGERRALRPKRRPGRPRKHPRPEPVLAVVPSFLAAVVSEGGQKPGSSMDVASSSE